MISNPEQPVHQPLLRVGYPTNLAAKRPEITHRVVHERADLVPPHARVTKPLENHHQDMGQPPDGYIFRSIP